MWYGVSRELSLFLVHLEYKHFTHRFPCSQYVVFYTLGVQLDAFGVEGEELQTYVRDSMGILGLKLMKVAYEDTAPVYTLDTLKTMYVLLQIHPILIIYGIKCLMNQYCNLTHIFVLTLTKSFKTLLDEEVALAESNFTSRKRKMQSRKSSMLRIQNRRISDASMYMSVTRGFSATGLQDMVRDLFL